VLKEIVRLSSDAGKNRHECYLSVFQLIQRRDRELADASDALHLSTERATVMVCAAVRLRNPLRIETTERDSNSATFIALPALT